MEKTASEKQKENELRKEDRANVERIFDGTLRGVYCAKSEGMKNFLEEMTHDRIWGGCFDADYGRLFKNQTWFRKEFDDYTAELQ